MSIVKINAITVPRGRFDEFERRFATQAGKVSDAEGFEGFQDGPVGTASELWSFEVLETEVPERV